MYNALTIHGLAECEQLPNSVLDIQAFWKTTAYNLGGYTFSLDDIEHGVLRGKHAMSVVLCIYIIQCHVHVAYCLSFKNCTTVLHVHVFTK